MGLMTRARFFAVSLALVLGVTGCAGTGGGGMSRPAGSSSDRIVEAELETLHQFSALEAVRRLRPRWLQTRTSVLPQVHVDGNRVGAAENLNSLRASDIQEMRFLNAADATTRFGTNYVSGVILVTTKR